MKKYFIIKSKYSNKYKMQKIIYFKTFLIFTNKSICFTLIHMLD